MAKSEGASTSRTLLRLLRNPANYEQAWRTFLERYGPLIYRWCRRAGLGFADAEEVRDRVLCQLARAMRHFDYDPAHRFRGWLKTVVENAVRSFWRELERQPGARGSGDSSAQRNLEQIPFPPNVEDLVGELDDSLEGELQLALRIAACVRERVEPHTWDAFRLTALEERPAAEVAEQLCMKIAAVYVAKNRVGKMLRQQAAKLNGQVADARESQP